MSRYVTFGEIMLRLKSPGKMRFIQVPEFEATFGGGEANVAVGLANLGLDAAYVSVIHKNAIGNACNRELRIYGVNTDLIVRKGDRLGIYFLEEGSNQRPSASRCEKLCLLDKGMEIRRAYLLRPISPQEYGAYHYHCSHCNASRSKTEGEAEPVDEIAHYWCKQTRGLSTGKEVYTKQGGTTARWRFSSDVAL